ncbi:MAG: mechanosensitive ion channel family protein [Burkholderiales bacterium]
MLPSVLTLVAVLAVLWLLFWLLRRMLKRVPRSAEGDEGGIGSVENWADWLGRWLGRMFALVSFVVAVVVMLYGVGIEGIPKLTWKEVAVWLRGPGVELLFILGSAWVLVHAAAVIARTLPDALAKNELTLAERLDRRKRIETTARLLRWTLTAAVLAVAALMALKTIGVDVTPLLAGGAVVSVALGFGAQSLVKDIIAGVFLIVENHLRVGDIANINGKGGQVEEINLRTTVLRGFDGTVHVLQNGSISDLSNLTKKFSYYVIDLGVAYKESVDRVMDVLREIGEGLQADEAFAPKILAPLEVVGVDDFAESAVVIKMRIRTVPIEQWSVGRELRRRIKNRFDEEQIEMPYPHLSVHFGETSRPFDLKVARSARPANEAAASVHGASQREDRSALALDQRGAPSSRAR